MAIFRFSKWRSSAILGFENLKMLSADRVQRVSVPNFVAIGETVAEIWQFLRCSKWLPSAIFDLLYACFDNHRRVCGVFCIFAKFCLSKLAKWRFGGFHSIIGSSITRPWEGNSLHANTPYDMQSVARSSAIAERPAQRSVSVEMLAYCCINCINNAHRLLRVSLRSEEHFQQLPRGTFCG